MVYFSVNYLDIAPRHASIIHGISNTIATISGIVTPTLTGYIVQNKLESEWQIVFYVAAGIYLIGCIVYWFCSSGELQSWAVLKINLTDSVGRKNVAGYVNEAVVGDVDVSEIK